MMAILDIVLIASLAVPGLAVAVLLAWAFVYSGRTGYSAERRGQRDGQ
jgi:hypothetical protein